MILQAHLDSKEKELLQKYFGSGTIGHNGSKGTAREYFIKGFLREHLGAGVAIATGEVIDSTCGIREKRPQIDVIIYDSNFPKINHDSNGDLCAVMVEAVRATIEVKSLLTKEELRKAVKQAVWIKERSNIQYLQRRINWMPIRTFVVVYECESQVEQVAKWLNDIHQELDIKLHPANSSESHAINNGMSPTIDAVVLLGKGFVSYHNPFMCDAQKQNETARWHVCQQESNNLTTLFIELAWVSNGTHLREYLGVPKSVKLV